MTEGRDKHGDCGDAAWLAPRNVIEVGVVDLERGLEVQGRCWLPADDLDE